MDKKPLDPGCDRYTRPEEIAALSKFLGEVKAVQEDYIEKFGLSDKPDQMTTGENIEPDKLGTYVDQLEVPGLNGGLSDYREDLHDPRQPILPQSVVPLDGTTPAINLPNQIETLSGGGSGIDSLGEFVDKITPPDDSLLFNDGSGSETIGSDVEALPGYTTEDVALPGDYLERLGGVNSENTLGETRVNIPGQTSDTPLSEYRENLSGISEVDLPDYREDINVSSLDKLPDYVDRISPTGVSLPNHLERIDVPEGELTDFIEKLVVGDDTKLSDTVLKINPDDVPLSDHLEKIEPTDIELGDTVLKISPKDTELGDKVEPLHVLDKNRLDETVLKISPDDVPLSDHLEKIEGKEVDLGNYVEPLAVPEDNRLDDTLLTIKPGEVDLPDYREDIKTTDIDKLPDFVEKIEPTDVPLSDHLEKIEPTDIELGDTVLKISPKDTELGDKVEPLHVLDKNRLDETVLKISPDDVPLSDHLEKIEGKEVELPETILTIDPKETGLSDEVVNLSVSDNNRLGDTRVDLKNLPDPSLADDSPLPLSGERKETKLGEKVIGLKIETTKELGDTSISVPGNPIDHDLPETTLSVPGDIPGNELGKDVIGLTVPDNNKLDDKIERLNARDDVELGKEVTPIPGRIENTDLSNYRENLIVPGVTELDETVLNLSGATDIDLPDKVVELTGVKDENELPNVVLPLDQVEDKELPETVIGLDGSSEVDLPEVVLGLEGVTDKELPDVRLDIEPKDVELPDTRLDIAPQDVELPDVRLDIEPKEVDLPNTRLDISPSDVELPNVKLDIKPEDKDLPDVRLDIEPKDVELPNVRLDIAPEDKELPDIRLDISPTDVDLPDTILGLEGVTDKELPDTILEIPGEGDRSDKREAEIEYPKRLDSYILGNEVPQDASLKVPGQQGTEVTELPTGIRGVDDSYGELDDPNAIRQNGNPPLSRPRNRNEEPKAETITDLLENFPFPEAPNLNPSLSEGKEDIRNQANLPEAPIEWLIPENTGEGDEATTFETRKSEFDEDGNLPLDWQDRETDTLGLSLEPANIPQEVLGAPENTNETSVDDVFDIRRETILGMGKDFGGTEIDNDSEAATERVLTEYSPVPLDPKEEEQQVKFKLLSALEKTDDEELFNTVLSLTYPDGGNRSEFDKKMASLVSTYLSSSSISGPRSVEYQKKFEAAFNLPSYKGDNMYRKAAEEAKKLGHSYASRRDLLETTLWALISVRDVAEEATGLTKSALPGGIGSTAIAQTLYKTLTGDVGVGEAVKGVAMSAAKSTIKAGVGALLGEETHEHPQNYPQVKRVLGIVSTGITETTGWEQGNSRVSSSKSLLGKVLNSVVSTLAKSVAGDLLANRSYRFGTNYISPLGVQTTLRDLCMNSSPGSVEELFQTLKDSPYITTPSKFGTVEKGNYKVMSLDTNAYWEVILEPLCDTELNGGYSYLPAFHEINTINLMEHGATTDYSVWVPVNSFDLQKSKVSTKSLGLYDGEISYPVSVELTNELKLTIVDDQYKSWKRYFETCAEVAVYNSTPHKAKYYDSPSDSVTVIDKTHICVALYKNVTFRCRIYIMTPQYSTVRSYDLLVVMKDFAEEYSGEVDAGGSSDLTVNFSIVGECPEDVTSVLKKTAKAQYTNSKLMTTTRKATKIASKIKTYVSILS